MTNTVIIPVEKTAAALAALYNASRPLGLGILHYTPEDMTEGEAAKILAVSSYCDYVKGRVIKTSFKGGETSLALFDRDNGEGAGARALRAAGVIA